jgi:hypothetical protein
MAQSPSRGAALSAYSPLFHPQFGLSVYGANLKAQFISGTLVSGQTVVAVPHTLGAVPKFIQVAALPTKAQAISGTGVDIFLAQAASATTSTTFYIVGSQKTNTAMKYNAWLILN